MHSLRHNSSIRETSSTGLTRVVTISKQRNRQTPTRLGAVQMNSPAPGYNSSWAHPQQAVPVRLPVVGLRGMIQRHLQQRRHLRQPTLPEAYAVPVFPAVVVEEDDSNTAVSSSIILARPDLLVPDSGSCRSTNSLISQEDEKEDDEDEGEAGPADVVAMYENVGELLRDGDPRIKQVLEIFPHANVWQVVNALKHLSLSETLVMLAEESSSSLMNNQDSDVTGFNSVSMMAEQPSCLGKQAYMHAPHQQDRSVLQRQQSSLSSGLQSLDDDSSRKRRPILSSRELSNCYNVRDLI
jgi:hypothetical protein